MRRTLIISAILISLFIPLSSAVYIEAPDYETGIASAGVMDMINGRYGDVIFATDYGISVYTAEGTWYSVNTRHPDETPYGRFEFLDDMVSAITLDSDGHLWLGYPGGLQFQTRTGYESIQDQQFLKNLGINCMVRWGDEVWIATGRAGLHRYHDGEWTWYKPDGPENLGCYTIVSMAVDAASGALIIGSERDGVWMVRDRAGEIWFEPVAYTKDWDFDTPSCIATDSWGSVYVGDSGNKRIQKFNGAGSLLATFGGRYGEFSSPDDIAVDADGNIYAVDGRTHCVQKFSGSGNLIAAWGSYGTGAGEFRSPAGIATDAAGNVYVADTGNHRIQKFGTSGELIAEWGRPGAGNGEFSYPVGVAIDTSGNVYVVDSVRVQKFDSSGRYLLKWGEGEFWSPTGIAVSASGSVYVTDRMCIQKFDGTGTLQKKWGAPGSGDGEFLMPAGVAVDTAGNVYVVDQDNHRIQKFDGSGALLNKWAPEKPGKGEFQSPSGIVVDVLGNTYAVDTGSHTIQKFDRSGRYITTIGSPGTGDGEFWRPEGIAIDGERNIYVADSSNHRVQKLDSFGRVLKVWGRPGSGVGEFISPTDIAINAAGDIYVVDSGNHRIQVFDNSSRYISAWGDGDLQSPTGIAVDTAGDIYVTDSGNHLIRKFDGSGRLLSTWRSECTCESGIAIDASGNIYVTDTGAGQIRVFDASGRPLKALQSPASPSGITLDASGSIYVTGRGGHCIQKFVPGPAFGYTYAAGWGTIACQSEPIMGISEVRADSLGGVYLFNSAVVLRYAPGAGVIPVLQARDLDDFPVTINDVAATSEGELFIASDNGIYRWDGSGIDLHITTLDGIRSNVVKKLFIDIYGRCWFVVPGHVGYIPSMTDSASLDLNPDPTEAPEVIPTVTTPPPEETPYESPEVPTKGIWVTFMEWLGKMSGGRIGR